MTEKQNRPQHGGARPGAGRKKKGTASGSLSEIDLKAALAAPAPDEIETPALRKSRAAIDVLVKRMVHGRGEAAKIQAANAILDRGYGKPSVAVGGDPSLPFLGSAPIRELGLEIRDEARKYATVALEVLDRIAQFGNSESASVAAAKSLLDRGIGTVAVAKLPDEFAGLRKRGKKERAALAAEAAGTGRYAPPAPPKRLQ
jgi:hypothetical protein